MFGPHAIQVFMYFVGHHSYFIFILFSPSKTVAAHWQGNMDDMVHHAQARIKWEGADPKGGPCATLAREPRL